MTGTPAVSAADLRVALDATPLAGTRTGIGRYVERLAAELDARADVDLRLAAFTVRHRRALRAEPGRLVHRPVPARLLQQAWLRGDRPAAETVTGRADVVHGTNFVLPPPRRAAGVVTVHDLTFARYPELVEPATLRYRTLVPRALARAGRVLAPTRAIADEIAAELRRRRGPAGRYAARRRRPAGSPRTRLRYPACPVSTCWRSAPMDRARGWTSCSPPTASCSARVRPPAAGAGRCRRLGSGPDVDGIPADRLHATGFLPPAALVRVVAHAAAAGLSVALRGLRPAAVGGARGRHAGGGGGRAGSPRGDGRARATGPPGDVAGAGGRVARTCSRTRRCRGNAGGARARAHLHLAALRGAHRVRLPRGAHRGS